MPFSALIYKQKPVVIQNCPVLYDASDNVGGQILYCAGMMIDGDGIGPSHNDPDYQNDTTLHQNGVALNADVDQYIVLPPQIIDAVEGIVLGCKATVMSRINNKVVDAVVGDVGPHSKLGEASIATAAALGVPSSPTTGGDAAHVYEYRIWPGVPAVVNGKTYTLQPS